MNKFSTTTYGKWILAGEHTVLRGGSALVFPIPEKQLSLKYTPATHPLDVSINGYHLEKAQHLFWQAFNRALKLIKKPIDKITGHFELNNDIPISSGMGASAAFCVALARWFSAQGWLPSEQLFNFARELENEFHTQSSGVDIAACLLGKSIEFHRETGCKPLEMDWHPVFHLTHSGIYSKTTDAVKQVQALQTSHPKLSKLLDDKMKESVLLAKQALLDPIHGREKLKMAIDKAHDCFRQWELIPQAMEEKIKELQKKGAIACKPTGAGGGGLIASLWDKKMYSSLIDGD